MDSFAVRGELETRDGHGGWDAIEIDRREFKAGGLDRLKRDGLPSKHEGRADEELRFSAGAERFLVEVHSGRQLVILFCLPEVGEGRESSGILYDDGAEAGIIGERNEGAAEVIALVFTLA